MGMVIRLGLQDGTLTTGLDSDNDNLRKVNELSNVAGKELNDSFQQHRVSNLGIIAVLCLGCHIGQDWKADANWGGWKVS